MGLFDIFRSRPQKQNVLPSNENVPQLVTVHDRFGRRYEIPRKEWQSKVLPDNLRNAYGDADALYQVIIMALGDGFHEDLLDASERLMTIDANAERSHVVRAIVLLKNGHADRAENVLTDLIRKDGATGVLLTNLAKVYAEQGRNELAEKTLWQAIQLDPNQENGLMWWTALAKEREGESGFWEAMSKAAGLPRSWRPQLWIARHHLEQKKRPEALQLYQQVLAIAADEPDVLMQISGDLGNARLVDDILQLLVPIYDPQRHDVRAGFNLLQAYLATKNVAEGDRLLHRIAALERPDLKEHLIHIANEFDKLKQENERPATPPEEPIAIVASSFDRPIWYYGLNNPRWLLSVAESQKNEIVFVSLANTSKSDLKNPIAQREDELGRLTRAIPLYLAESLFISTDLKPRMVVPVVNDVGPVVYGFDWPEEHIFSMANGARHAITGHLAQQETTVDIHLIVWDCQTRHQVEAFDTTCSMEQIGQHVLTLEGQLLDLLRLGKAGGSGRNLFYCRPQPSEMNLYLICLGQSFMLTAVRNDLVPKDRMWGERNMIETFLSLALQMKNCQVPKIMLLSALATAKGYGTTVHEEYREQMLMLLEDEKDANGPFVRLSPLLFKLYEMTEAFHDQVTRLSHHATPDYLQWLSELEK